MADLLSAMPGLAMHVTEVPAEASTAAAVTEPVVVFEDEKAMDLLREAGNAIAAVYPPNSLSWLQQNRPDVFRELARCRNEVDDAFRAKDMELVMKAIDRYRRAHLRAWTVVKTERGPVADVQQDLLQGAAA